MAKTRVSIVQYLNAVPLAWGLLEGAQKEEFESVLSTPAECADQLRSGSVDIGLIPSIEYQTIPGARIIPGPAITSRHRVESVILLSIVPLSQVRTVAYDRTSRASVMLARIIFSEFYKKEPEFRPAEADPERMLAGHDAALLIGDVALAYRAANRLPNAEKQRAYIREGHEPVECFDLMERWHNLTGLPFVFAFWATRKGFTDRSIVDKLIASRRFGLAEVERIADRYAEKLSLDRDFLLRYLTRSVDYHMDADCVAALETFYTLAARLGAIKSVRKLEFL